MTPIKKTGPLKVRQRSETVRDLPQGARGAAATHCAFYVMSTGVLRAHAADLKAYEVGKGSVQFGPDEPLPATLVTKIVRARLAENGKRGYR